MASKAFWVVSKREEGEGEREEGLTTKIVKQLICEDFKKGIIDAGGEEVGTVGVGEAEDKRGGDEGGQGKAEDDEREQGKAEVSKASTVVSVSDLEEMMKKVSLATPATYEELVKKSENVQETVGKLQAFLKREQDNSQLISLVESKHFFEILVTALRSEMKSIHKDVSFVLAKVAELGDDFVASDVDAKGVTTLLLEMLGSADPSVQEKIIMLLGLLTAHKDVRKMLVKASIFGALLTVVKANKSTGNQEVLEHVSRIMTKILLGDVQEKGFEDQDVRAALPPARLVKDSLPLISLLLDVKNAEIHGEMTQCLSVATAVLTTMEPFSKAGLCSKIASLLAHANQNIVLASGIILGNMSNFPSKEFLEFFKALRGTQAMKSFENLLKLDWDFLRNSKKFGIPMALTNISNAIAKILGKTDSVNAIIDSGFAHSLVTGLKTTNTDNQARLLSLFTLRALFASVMDREASDDHKNTLKSLDVMDNLLQILKSENWAEVFSAAAIFAVLVQKDHERRDELIRRGILPILSDIVLGELKVQARCDSLKALHNLLDSTPLAPFETMECVLDTLNTFYEKMCCLNCMAECDIMQTSIKCVGLFFHYQHPGINAVFERPNIVRKVFDEFLGHDAKCEHGAACMLADIQSEAAGLVLGIFMIGGSEQHQKLLETGVLRHFGHLLDAPIGATRKIAVMSLAFLMMKSADNLTPDQKREVVSLRGFIGKEIQRKDSDTLQLASAIYQGMLIMSTQPNGTA